MTSSLPPTTPVIIGVGQYLNRDLGTQLDPIALAATAARLAAEDATAPRALADVDAIAVVPIVSWRYSDPGRLVAAAIGAEPSLTMYPLVGGNTPQMLMNRVCERIAAGSLNSALICGAEAYRTRMRTRKAGESLDWERQDPDLAPGWTDGEIYEMGHAAELALGIMMPTQAYPLFENALTHASGRTPAEQRHHIAEIWAGFSAVAAHNPNAWDRTAHSVAEIETVTESNRIIGYPYNKHMVSNPDVEMASAVIVCSVQRATELGVPRDQWVFPHSGSDAKDPYMSERPSFTGSGAIRHAGRAALELAGVGIDDIAHLDVYSCFPSAVQIACAELGIDTGRQLTVSGGLCFAGGPWNNPVGHAIAAMVGTLRADAGSIGLVTANGGNIQKHSFGVYSTEPPAAGFRTASPQFAVDTEPRVEVVADHLGVGTLETFTVMHERDGSRGRAHAVVRTPRGSRTWATTSDPEITELLEGPDPIGMAVTVVGEAELRLA